MPAQQKSIEAKLEALNQLDLSSDPKAAQAALQAALAERHYRIVGKGAELAGERLFYELQAPLREAYERFLRDPVKTDPNCIAKRAIARALVALECNHVAFYLQGVSYRQMEPVWGGSVDTAIDVRTSCAMGLVATGYPRALHELMPLLCDAEARARQGAIRAIACANPREAELLLRFKAGVGDSEPEVMGECFAALLSVAPEESLAFVAKHLERGVADDVREAAALALGESRLEAALPCFRQAWDNEMIMTEFRRALIRAAVLHRSEAAFDWLLSMLAEGHASVGELAIQTLAIYKHNDRLRERIKAVLMERNERRLSEAFAQAWSG